MIKYIDKFILCIFALTTFPFICYGDTESILNNEIKDKKVGLGVLKALEKERNELERTNPSSPDIADYDYKVAVTNYDLAVLTNTLNQYQGSKTKMKTLEDDRKRSISLGLTQDIVMQNDNEIARLKQEIKEIDARVSKYQDCINNKRAEGTVCIKILQFQRE